ncbi:dihydroorotate dehydrogenase-like protein [Geopsychrobacter electrodiphilus]|uniref:dihydroorotate dehydrogenase-like protein n=1 Tax=Geopsychrobacter electrodiphilus TaxID=225196 RepID=UPI00035D6C03|nr:dihydroorotate dehydrogenase-like protein [Geopsychrobacter electrodiphilus]
MLDLSTPYMGLNLANPLVVSSSSLTGNLNGVKQAAAAGAGAIVLKSLFEEQIAAETAALGKHAEQAGHTEAAEYLQGYGKELGPQAYLQLIRDAVKTVDVPIIASLNCFSRDSWSDYAKKMESAGAAALELNIGLLPSNSGQQGRAIEERYYQILHEVKTKVKIPVALKIGPYFSSFGEVAAHLGHDRAEAPAFSVGWCGPGATKTKIVWRKADALVLFNRFYQLDIDIENLELVAGNPLSSSSEINTSLRWIALLYQRVESDLAATTGIHDSRDVIKQLLAGATVVQLCSTLMKNGFGQIERIRKELETWMQAHDFSRIDQFRGRLSQARSQHPANYERLQYIKLFVGLD